MTQELIDYLDYYVVEAGRRLEEACEKHLDLTPHFWFRSPYMHVIEFTLMSVFLFFLLATWLYFRLPTTPPKQTSQRSLIDIFVGLVLLSCFFVHCYVKFSKTWRDLGYMTMPCHLLTLCISFCLLKNTGKTSRKCFNLSLYFAWAPLIALLTPDFDDHVYDFEPALFIIHHVLLLIAPFYCCFRHERFELVKINLISSLEVTFVGFFINYVFQTVASYITGLNINYHLFPPPLPGNYLKGDQHYRIKCALFLLGLSFASRIAIPRVTALISGVRIRSVNTFDSKQKIN